MARRRPPAAPAGPDLDAEHALVTRLAAARDAAAFAAVVAEALEAATEPAAWPDPPRVRRLVREARRTPRSR